MAEKILNSRIVNKHDSLENWLASSLILKAGEIAIAEIPQNATGSGLTPPAIGIKVGDGEHTFSKLSWIEAIAGDVSAWAKAASKPSYTATEISAEVETADGKTVASRLAALETAVADDMVYRILKDNTDNKWYLQSKKASEADSAFVTVSIVDLKDILDGKQDNLTFEGTYNASTNKVATESTVKNAIQAIDVEDTAVAGQYISAIGIDANGKLDITRVALPDYSNTYADKAYENKVDTLIGADTKKSVRTIANEELTAQLIPDGAKESLDTLQEIAAWIQAHPDDVAAMNARTDALKNALSHFVTVNPETGAYTVTADAVKDYIDGAASAAVNDLDVDDITGFGAGKTLASLTQTDGRIAATFQAISITLSQISDAGDAAALDVADAIVENGGDLPTAGVIYAYVQNILSGLASSVAATAADGDQYSVLTGVTQANGVLSAKTEVKLAAIAKTGNVNDLIQTSGDVLVFDCGDAE